MFTGIIEALGTVGEIIPGSGNLSFIISCPFASELKIDQSVAHNGVCLTVEETLGNRYRVTAIEETLNRTHFRELIKGDLLNLERSLKLNGRLDGHWVQGHVDTTAVCESIGNEEGSRVFTFKLETSHDGLIIEKGSIAVNGISLTVVSQSANRFSVAVIPFTLRHTNLCRLAIGQKVNIEFDMIGKYVKQLVQGMKLSEP